MSILLTDCQLGFSFIYLFFVWVRWRIFQVDTHLINLAKYLISFDFKQVKSIFVNLSIFEQIFSTIQSPNQDLTTFLSILDRLLPLIKLYQFLQFSLLIYHFQITLFRVKQNHLLLINNSSLPHKLSYIQSYQ